MVPVALARLGLHDVSAALPLPRRRPDPRAPQPRGRARHRRPPGPRGPLRPAAGRAHRGDGHLDAPHRVGDREGAGRGARHRAVRLRRRGAGVARLRRPPARDLLPPRGPQHPRARRARAARRDRTGERPGPARLRRPARPQRRRRPARRRLQDGPRARRGLRAEGAVPDALLRPGPLAGHRNRPAPASAALPRQRAGAALRARRPPAVSPAGRSRAPAPGRGGTWANRSPARAAGTPGR